MIFDTHCHLNDKAYEKDREAVIEQASSSGITIIDIATTIASSKQSISLAQNHNTVYATIGFHPEEGSQKNLDIKSVLSELKRLASQSSKVMAIGETGLDYYWLRKEGRSKAEFEDIVSSQKELFEGQVILAQEHSLPVIVHTRSLPEDADVLMTDAIAILQKYPDVTVVFHSYTGSLEYAKRFLSRGYFISFNGIVTFRKADEVRELFDYIWKHHRDQFFLETDGPYLAPEGKRGERNEPTWVEEVYTYLGARIKSEGFMMEDKILEEVIEKNVKGFFKIEIS